MIHRAPARPAGVRAHAAGWISARVISGTGMALRGVARTARRCRPLGVPDQGELARRGRGRSLSVSCPSRLVAGDGRAARSIAKPQALFTEPRRPDGGGRAIFSDPRSAAPSHAPRNQKSKKCRPPPVGADLPCRSLYTWHTWQRWQPWAVKGKAAMAEMGKAATWQRRRRDRRINYYY